MNKETQKYIDILKTKGLSKVEQDLLQINLDLINTPDRPNLNLDFVRKEGESGIKRLLEQVSLKHTLKSLFIK